MNSTKINFTKNLGVFGAVIAGLLLLSFQAGAQNETTTQTTVTTETQSSTIQSDSDAPRPRARAGFKGGLNVSNLITDEVTDKDPRYGFHAGVYGQLFANEAFAIQPELNKGKNLTRYESGFSLSSHLSLVFFCQVECDIYLSY